MPVLDCGPTLIVPCLKRLTLVRGFALLSAFVMIWTSLVSSRIFLASIDQAERIGRLALARAVLAISAIYDELDRAGLSAAEVPDSYVDLA